MKVLFLGSSHFSKIVLEKMIENGIDVSCVITQPDKPSGRGHKLTPTEVNLYARENGIEVKTFDKIRQHIDEIKEIDFDISVVASFGQILPNAFLDLKLCINVHPSLLPKYRGASPIQTTILNGDDETGVTIMKVAQAVDSGDIISQERISLNGEYYKELEEKLGQLGGDMICRVIDNYQNGKIEFTPQDDSQAILVQKFTKEDGKLDFNNFAKDIVNRVKALSETVGTYFYIDDMMIKVEKICDVSEEYNAQQNVIFNNKKHFVVGCNGGAVEILSCLSPSGKIVSGRDFINGHNDILSKRVNNA